MNYKYEEFSFSNKGEVEVYLQSTNNEEVIRAVVGMVNGIRDWKWVQNKLLGLVLHNDFWIAKNAIIGLGDIARIHGKLDTLKVKSILNLVNDPNLTPIVKSTIDDIDLFIKS